MATAQVGPSTIFYDDRGQGSPPVVLVHGFPLDGRVFERQLEAVAKRTRVIVPDLPGFGRSTGGGDFSIASLADELRSLLAQIGAVPCILGGLSMGGYVALAFATRHAADLRGLILIDTRSEADTAEGKANREKMIALVKEKGSAAVAEQMLPKMLAESTAHANPKLAARVREMMASQPPETVRRALAAMRDREDYSVVLGKLDVPTLIMVGEYDTITPPAMADAMHARLQRSWLSTVEGAGHLTPVERPERVTQLILRMVDELAITTTR